VGYLLVSPAAGEEGDDDDEGDEEGEG
jgi:hypothetical protein